GTVQPIRRFAIAAPVSPRAIDEVKARECPIAPEIVRCGPADGFVVRRGSCHARLGSQFDAPYASNALRLRSADEPRHHRLHGVHQEVGAPGRLRASYAARLSAMHAFEPDHVNTRGDIRCAHAGGPPPDGPAPGAPQGRVNLGATIL